MSLEICVLASGSSGNCTVVRAPAGGGVALLDVGLGPRMVATRLAGTGVALADISAICLTHLDRDHFNPNWVNTIVRRGIRVFCHADRVADLLRYTVGVASIDPISKQFQSLINGFDGEAFHPLPGVTVRPISFAHDRTGSHGFLADGYGSRIGYATDLGHVPAQLLEQFCDLDVLAIESNYDPQMQRDSARPWFLKQRIMGGHGHLSNQQAFEAVRTILDRCERAGQRLPRHIVLLHRSRECNCPDRLRTLFHRDARTRGRLTLAEQDVRSEWLRTLETPPFVGTQLELAWG